MTTMALMLLALWLTSTAYSVALLAILIWLSDEGKSDR